MDDEKTTIVNKYSGSIPVASPYESPKKRRTRDPPNPTTNRATVPDAKTASVRAFRRRGKVGIDPPVCDTSMGKKTRTTADGMKDVILPKTAVAATIPASTPGNECCTAMTSTLVATLENSVARIAEPARMSGDRVVRRFRFLEPEHSYKRTAPDNKADQ